MESFLLSNIVDSSVFHPVVEFPLSFPYHFMDGSGMPTADVCGRHGLSPATFYKFKAKYGGMELSEAARLKALEDENAKLKRLLADTMLDNVVLKDLLGKN